MELISCTLVLLLLVRDATVSSLVMGVLIAMVDQITFDVSMEVALAEIIRSYRMSKFISSLKAVTTEVVEDPHILVTE